MTSKEVKKRIDMFDEDQKGKDPMFTIISKALKPHGIYVRDLDYSYSTFSSPYLPVEYDIRMSAYVNTGCALSTEDIYTPEKIIRNKRTTIVIWKDKTKTIVRCEEDKCYDVYEAFTAALAKKIFQNNSKLKKMIKEKFVCQESDDAEIEWSFVGTPLDTAMKHISDAIVSTPLSRAMNGISDAIKNYNADNETE